MAIYLGNQEASVYAGQPLMTIADDSITTSMIQDGVITNAKLADGSVTNAKLAANSITSAKLAANSITDDKLANNTISKAKLAVGATNFQFLQLSTSRTMAASDNEKFLWISGSATSSLTFTLPANDSSIPVGAECCLWNNSSKIATVVAGTGASINGITPLQIPRFCCARIKKWSATGWSCEVSGIPQDGTVTRAKIAENAVTEEKTFTLSKNATWTQVSGYNTYQYDQAVSGALAGDKAFINIRRGAGGSGYTLNKSNFESDIQEFNKIYNYCIPEDGIVRFIAAEPLTTKDLYLTLLLIHK